MNIFIPASVLLAFKILLLVILIAAIGLALWAVSELWFAAINRGALLFGLHRELMYYMSHRVRLKELIEKELEAKKAGQA